MKKYLSKNLSALKKHVPGLYKWIKDQPDVDWVKEIKSKNGMNNFLVKEGSQLKPAYNMENSEEAALKEAEKATLFKETVTIILGFGQGYLAKALLNKKEKDHKILVIEPCGHIIRLALKNKDFAKAILTGDLIIVAPGKNEVAYVLNTLSNQYVVSGWFVKINEYTKFRPQEYAELLSFTKECLNSILCNTGTIAGTAGAKIADNDIACLPYVIKHRGVIELTNLFKNKPAILVSTGPSLSKNIHHLIDLKDKAVIIAVGQALRVLLAYGIRPDFICTVDFGEVNIGHFKGLMDCGVPLVTINRTYAPLLKEWQGPKFIAGTPVPGHEHTAAGILTKKGFMESGGSVAHLCFGLAQLLGCNPIIFTGQDLAYGKDNRSHIALADAGGKVKVDENGILKWNIEDQRCSLHGKQDYSMGLPQPIPGYYGKPVMTNMGLLSFLTAFQTMIESHLAIEEIK